MSVHIRHRRARTRSFERNGESYLVVVERRRLIDQFRRTLSTAEKHDYISAVQCFLKKPPITPKSVAAGVGARYDDFIATHIIQTFSIHYVVRDFLNGLMQGLWRLISDLGTLPRLAPILYSYVRKSSERRVWLQWCSTVRLVLFCLI